jgi:hypothetical protein
MQACSYCGLWIIVIVYRVAGVWGGGGGNVLKGACYKSRVMASAREAAPSNSGLPRVEKAHAPASTVAYSQGT